MRVFGHTNSQLIHQCYCAVQQPALIDVPRGSNVFITLLPLSNRFCILLKTLASQTLASRAGVPASLRLKNARLLIIIAESVLSATSARFHHGSDRLHLIVVRRNSERIIFTITIQLSHLESRVKSKLHHSPSALLLRMRIILRAPKPGCENSHIGRLRVVLLWWWWYAAAGRPTTMKGNARP